jgi:CDP-4-dehydro-6-deoxyglucose reductase
MPQLLPLSRAARLAGVSRGALQVKIRAGELETFEGKVKLSDLVRVYPQVEMDSSPMLERVEAIKASARPRREQEALGLPAAEVLVQRLESLGHVITDTKAELYRSTEILGTVARRLEALAEGAGGDLWPAVRALSAWLAEEVGKRPVQVDARARLFAKDTFLRILAANVKVIPSGHEFFVEGTASVLEAAVRSGLSLNYGCASGNCGSCKARLVSGQVWRTRDHDYVLSEREKGLGYFLMCSNTAVTDLVLEAAEAARASDMPVQQIVAATQRVERLSDELAILHLQTPRTQTLRFLAGQRATLTVAGEVSPALPIASCPCDGRHLEFHVRRVPGEAFSQIVFDRLRPTEPVTVTGPEGEFVLHDDTTKPLVFIAFDDGFAAIKSLVQQAISIDTADWFHLYWVVSRKYGLYLDNLCRSWRDALENFRYTPITLEGPRSNEQTVRALRGLIEGEPNLNANNFYICGPENFVSATAKLLRGHGLSQTQLRTERYPAA